MVDLKTKYMGMELKNPIIIGACNLLTEKNNLKKMEEAGAAAIVYKSLFEEQIQLESIQLQEELQQYNERNAEMLRLFPDMEHSGPGEYLMNLTNARKQVDIPFFASLNAVYSESWLEYAKKIEECGVDGIELNFYHIPKEFDRTEKSIVEEQIEILEELKSNLKIPIAVKLSPFYTNPLYVISNMDSSNIDAFVLFNRFFQPDINIHEEKNHFPYNLSNPEDARLSLRYAGILHDNIQASICANTGIYTGEDVIKMLLAGADAVQIVSTLYKNGIDHIQTMLSDMEKWMANKNYQSINDFKGKLSMKKARDPFSYKRAQYVDILFNSDDILKKYPQR
jgi:dihydroorotate dehydrogenase (fumarate)